MTGTIDPMIDSQTTHSDRISTGIAGLDQLVRGGLTAQRMYLVSGYPGTG